ncbi:MAG: hypothetical protein LBC74_10140 [Planctomycetaceae bacterium]|jgi:hypothetical protein|nr:hypothetical protein [Planctomycetaceae bacterium]
MTSPNNTYKIIKNIVSIVFYSILFFSDLVLAEEVEQVSGLPEKLILTFSVTKPNITEQQINEKNYKFIVGEEIVLNLTIKNVSNISLAYYLGQIIWPQNYTLFCCESNKTIRSLTRRTITAGPSSQEAVVILEPNEKKSHKIYFDSIFPWQILERGQLDAGTGCLGLIGNYVLSFECSIPPGTGDMYNQAGLSGNFFEGTMKGKFEFSIIPPPLDSKREILNQVRKILNNPPDFPGDENLRRFFLQGFYVAPKELQTMLLNYHQLTLSENGLLTCYLGLNMFDTPEAKAAIDAINTKAINSLKVNGKVDVIHQIILFRRIVLLIVSILLVLVIIFLVKRTRKNKINKNNN